MFYKFRLVFDDCIYQSNIMNSKDECARKMRNTIIEELTLEPDRIFYKAYIIEVNEEED